MHLKCLEETNQAIPRFVNFWQYFLYPFLKMEFVYMTKAATYLKILFSKFGSLYNPTQKRAAEKVRNEFRNVNITKEILKAPLPLSVSRKILPNNLLPSEYDLIAVHLRKFLKVFNQNTGFTVLLSINNIVQFLMWLFI